MRFYAAIIAALVGLHSESTLGQTPSAPPNLNDPYWYAPCKSGAADCAPYDREWTPHPGYVYMGATGDFVRVYVSKPPRQVIRGFPSIWVIFDYKFKPGGNSDGNVTNLYLVRCSDRAMNIIQQRLEKGWRQPNGESGWFYSGPGTINNDLVNLACAKPRSGTAAKKRAN